MKTISEKNMAQDKKQAETVRPKTPHYEFKELEQIVRGWILSK
jgi:hypothetical protein